jgi:DNA-binding ferritin-like protein
MRGANETPCPLTMPRSSAKNKFPNIDGKCKMLMHSWSDTRLPNYQAFWIVDKGMRTPHPPHSSEEEFRERMRTQDHWIAIWTERDAYALFCVEVYDSEPNYSPIIWDHIVEASIHLPTGGFQVAAGCLGVFTEFQVLPGWYRVRAFHSIHNLNDHQQYYRIVVWPAPFSPLNVIKQFSPHNFSESICLRMVEVLVRRLAHANDLRAQLVQARMGVVGPNAAALQELFFKIYVDVSDFWDLIRDRVDELGGNLRDIGAHYPYSGLPTVNADGAVYVKNISDALATHSTLTRQASDEAYVIGDKESVDLLAYIARAIGKWRSEVEAQGQVRR